MKKGLIFLAIGVLGCWAGWAAEGNRPADPGKVPVFGETDYRLGPEDLLAVFIWKEPDISTEVKVRPDGKISLPLVGELIATSKTVPQLEKEIREKLSLSLTDPVVNVLVKEVNSPKISVLGEVRRPDRYLIRQKVTVLDVIALAGGFTEFAKRDEVIVIRNGSSGTQRIEFNLERLLKKGHGEPFYLLPSDTVYVK